MTGETRLPTMEEFKAMVDRHDWFFPWGPIEDCEAGRESLALIRAAVEALGPEAQAYYRARNPLCGPSERTAQRGEDDFATSRQQVTGWRTLKMKGEVIDRADMG